MLDQHFDATKALGTTLAVVAFTCAVTRRQPPGVVRLVFILPALLLFYALPLGLSRITMRGGIGFLLCWMVNGKLIAFCANRGPLAIPGLSTLQFLALMVLPLSTGKTNPRHNRSFNTIVVLLVLTIKACTMAGLTMMLTGPELPLWVRHTAYAAYIYVFVSILLDSFLPLAQYCLFSKAAATAHHTPSVILHPGMNAPLISTTIREFWGKRYNQLVSDNLFDCVYAPIMDGRWVRQPGQQGSGQQGSGQQGQADSQGMPATYGAVSRTRKTIAMFAVFLVSGLLHELMIWYMCPNSTPALRQQGKMVMFFIVQPPLIALQDWVFGQVAVQMQPVLKVAQRLRVAGIVYLFGRMLAVPITLGALLGTAELWFWSPFESCSIDKVGLGEFRSGLDAVKALLGF